MNGCSKCYGFKKKLIFCAECWSKWPKGVSLEEFIKANNLPEPPKIKHIPYHLAYIPLCKPLAVYQRGERTVRQLQF